MQVVFAVLIRRAETHGEQGKVGWLHVTIRSGQKITCACEMNGRRKSPVLDRSDLNRRARQPEHLDDLGGEFGRDVATEQIFAGM